MTEGPLQLRILRYTLLGPIDDARHILRRLQNNEAFQHYLRRRTLRALPLVVGILLTSLACSAAVMFLFFRAGILLVLAATIVVAPIVLIASFSVQAYVLLSWLEGRALAKLQEHHRPRHRGPIGQWLARSYRIDMGPLPQVPWIPALVFFLGSAAEQHVALGMLLVGVALLLAGLASIVTKRMSFRFYGSARTSYAGATALITGMMQVIVGGLAVATAHALATHVWQARLDALLTNPWPLLIPLGLLLIGAGLFLVRGPPTYDRFIGTVLFILPKTLTGVAALGAGAAILVGWAWKIYDPKAFLGFVRLFPDECMNLLANWWSAAIALLR